MHSSVFLCCLSPTTAVCVETHTIVSTAFNLVAQLVVHMARTSNDASANWLSAINVLSVHLKSDLYLDAIWVACVASPSVRSRRLETWTCSLCSIGTCTKRHSTCICTLPVSLRDSVAPPGTSVRLSKRRSPCIRGSAWPVVTHPVTLCANCRH